MLRQSRKRLGGGGGIIDKLIPGWQDKLWAKYPPAYKAWAVQSENNAFEAWIKNGHLTQKVYATYLGVSNNFKPDEKYRKQTVDWRRQLERGTMVHGRWYEGPYGSNYTPGNSFDRLQNVEAPFTDAEWTSRKQFRTFDLMKFTLICFGVYTFYRVTTEVPVVWCEEPEQEEQ